MPSSRTRTPYEDTSVPVSRSQGKISDILREAGAHDVAFSQSFETGQVMVRFTWTTETATRVAVKLVANPLPPERTGTSYNPGSTWRISPEQRDRQVWRSIAWYLESMFKAVSFGLMRFEDVFLSFIEAEPGGATIGEYAIPRLEAAGRLSIEAEVR